MAVITGTAGNDSLAGTSSADSITGSSGNDSIDGLGGNDTAHGGSGDDSLRGGGGSDLLRGNGGTDVLSGGLGADNLGGGTGADIFAFSDMGATNADSITDFVSGEDVIELDGSVFTGIGAGASIVFEAGTRQLWYDADGSGAGARQLIATLQSGATLAASDIVVSGGGTPPGNVINGTEGDDTLDGSDQAETINGLGGDDVIRGNGGADTLDGGAGNDTFYVLSDDVLADSGGTDTVIANQSRTLAAGFENLFFDNFEFDDNGLPGLQGVGNSLANEMRTYIGNGGLLDGAGGNDTLVGASFEADTLIGNAGNDVLDGGGGGDRLVFNVAPGAGNADLIVGFASGSARIVLDGDAHAATGPSGVFAAGDGRFVANTSGMATDTSDRVIYNSATGELWYDADGNGAGARQLVATLQGAPALAATDIEIVDGSNPPGSVINGSAGNDQLAGGEGNDTLNGFGGNDTILAGGGGEDFVDGGSGRDSIDLRNSAQSGIVVDFSAGTLVGGQPGSIAFISIERVVGSIFDDSMSGNGAAQNLTGQSGADTLWGAGGIDTLWGGNGGDFFVFREMGTANADRISDFVSGTDELHLDGSVFAGIGSGFFAANASGTAQDANDRVIYDTETGRLYYDADGSGGGAAQLVAIVVGDPALAASDITVI
jgi:Ca2+-binding RTX toxin-like protein